ncbi:MAG: hypothetical protein IPL40_04265 [Proteobacteria bacterium]|nr:hypothetical protein [Pseudomonadota bacterium]
MGSNGRAGASARADGSLWCWGQNSKGQVGDGTTGGTASPAAVTTLGTAVADTRLGTVRPHVRAAHRRHALVLGEQQQRTAW